MRRCAAATACCSKRKYAPDECETGLHYAERSFARTEILRLEILAVSAKGKRVK